MSDEYPTNGTGTGTPGTTALRVSLRGTQVRRRSQSTCTQSAPPPDRSTPPASTPPASGNAVRHDDHGNRTAGDLAGLVVAGWFPVDVDHG